MPYAAFTALRRNTENSRDEELEVGVLRHVTLKSVQELITTYEITILRGGLNATGSPHGEYFPRKVGVTLPDGTLRQLSVAGSVPEFVKNYQQH